MAWPCGDIQNIKNELRLNVCYPIFIFKEAIPTITSISSWGYFPSIQRLPFSFPILCFATFLFFSRNDGYQRFISYFSLEVSQHKPVRAKRRRPSKERSENGSKLRGKTQTARTKSPQGLKRMSSARPWIGLA